MFIDDHYNQITMLIITLTLTWNTTLDFSRRYVLMFAPMMSPFLPKPISIYFPKRLLLSFRVVLAFPTDCRQKKVNCLLEDRRKILIS